MKRVIKIVLVALLLSTIHLPQSTVRAQLLYEVSGNSAKAKSYIFATNPYVDVSYLDSLPLFTHIFDLFDQCERVVTEFAFQDYEALAALRQSSVLPDSVSLSDLFSPSDYEYIRTACLSMLSLDIDSLQRLKPSYLTALYRDELLHRWLSPQLPISIYFEALAGENEIPVIGLDNASETMYIAFEREPLAWQCQELVHLLNYPEKEVAQVQNLRQSYLNGRLNDIAFLIAAPDNETTISYSDYKVFCQRNKQWTKRLTPYFKDGRTFVTLDAIYLGGDEGLIAQLRSAGFRVKAINKRIKIKQK